MIVLGVDPGTLRCGWGVVQREGMRVRGIACGVIRTRDSEPLEQRLHVVHAELVEVIRAHKPNCMAVEDVFAKHVRSALTLGQARGVVLLAGAQAELAVAAYPPALVKRAIAGDGNAPKEQVARMIGTLLGLRELPALDATDALAIAITHANALGTQAAPSARMIEAIRTAKAASARTARNLRKR